MTTERTGKVTITLTAQEALDVQDMVSHFRRCTDWSENPSRERLMQNPPEHMAAIKRKRALALRLVRETRVPGV